MPTTRISNLWAVLILTLVALRSVPAAWAYEERVLSDISSGWVEGAVRVDRDVSPKQLPVTVHREGCGSDPKRGGIEASDQLVRDVAVYLKEISAGVPLPTAPAVLDQQGCVFVPRVFAVVRGQPLLIRNSDDVLHNVTATIEGKTLFKLAMPIKGQELWKKPLKQDGALLEQGRVRFACEAGHVWMEAFAIVLPHPYLSVTGTDGAFRLENVPPGNYELVFWHPALGEHRQTVSVEAREGVRVDLTFPIPSE